MSFSILAFRPGSVVERLGPRNEACPLSTRDILAAVASAPLALPMIQAPAALVARAALVAAKEARSVIGLALPPGVAPEGWFAAMAEAADVIAPALPIFLSGQVAVRGKDARARERAYQEAYRLVEAGITHVAVDLQALPAAERAAAFGEVQAAMAEREIGVEYLLRADEPPSTLPALFRSLQERGTAPDLVGVSTRLEAPGAEEARRELQRMAQVCAAFGRTPLICRGRVARHLSARIPGSPVKLCEDGGAAAQAALRALPPAVSQRFQSVADGAMEPPEHGAADFAGWEAELPSDVVERAEARAYVQVAGLIEDLTAAGSAVRVHDALASQLGEG